MPWCPTLRFLRFKGYDPSKKEKIVKMFSLPYVPQSSMSASNGQKVQLKKKVLTSRESQRKRERKKEGELTRDTTAEARLGVSLVLLVSVATSWTTTHFD
jgi:hypothetical protein